MLSVTLLKYKPKKARGQRHNALNTERQQWWDPLDSRRKEPRCHVRSQMKLSKGSTFLGQGKAKQWKKWQEWRAFWSRCCCWFLAQVPDWIECTNASVWVGDTPEHSMSSAGPREKEKGRKINSTNQVVKAHEGENSASSSALLSLHLVPQSVVSASLSGIEGFGHAFLLYRNSTKVVEKVLHNQPFYSLLKQTIYKIE